MAIAGAILVGGVATFGISHYFSPKYARVGYKPIQPVSFSHTIHADQLGLDCRYCHDGVEKSWYSNVPAASTCMNCHNQVLKDDPRLAAVRESFATGKPIPWVQIHKLPDYVYFNHSVHVNRGVSCVECHGQVNKMDEVKHAKSLGMPFCLDCHRNPEERVRPLKEVYNLDWQRPEDYDGKSFVHDWKLLPGDSCSVCHR